MTSVSQSWHHARLALDCLASSQTGLGGAVIRMRSGPARDTILAALRRAFPAMIRLHPGLDDTQLFGGVDIAGTLQSGTVRRSPGLLQGPAVFCLTMAERCPPDLAAKIAQFLDQSPESILFALDEGADDGEACPEVLSERLAFALSPEDPAQDFEIKSTSPPKLAPKTEDAQIDLLTQAAADFGISSMRAPMQALLTARGLAACEGLHDVSDGNIAQAAALVYAHRATRLPPEASEKDLPQDQTSQDMADPSDPAGSTDQMSLPSELVVEAVRALLPPHMLAGLGRGTLAAKGKGAGQKRKGNRRGRPLPSLPGRLDGRKRLDLVATLRCAAPWQPIRRRAQPDRSGLLIRPSDFRVKRFESQSDRVLIFVVDASGSAAVSRLNEAKGAIELLLGEAYAARDHVALVSFRDTAAQVLLPPTRSLVQTKRRLAALPGGGGTPLAAGLKEALAMSLQARSAGMTPLTVLMTDGKANIDLDGEANRTKAQEDSVRMARAVRSAGLETLVIDMSRRPRTQLRDLAQYLDGPYFPMPRADAAAVSGLVRSNLSAR